MGGFGGVAVEGASLESVRGTPCTVVVEGGCIYAYLHTHTFLYLLSCINTCHVYICMSKCIIYIKYKTCLHANE